MKKIIILALVFSLLISGCSIIPESKSDCSKNNVNNSIQQLDRLTNQWADMLSLANETPRAYVINTLIELEHIKWNVDDVEVPVCLNTAKGDLESSMSLAIDGMAKFLGQATDNEVNQKLGASTTELSNYRTEIDRIKKCAPDCTK